jgi:hypothetical protein
VEIDPLIGEKQLPTNIKHETKIKFKTFLPPIQCWAVFASRIVFVGDSIGRNQWESLICMLAEVVQNKLQLYEANGSPIIKNKGFCPSDSRNSTSLSNITGHHFWFCKAAFLKGLLWKLELH